MDDMQRQLDDLSKWYSIAQFNLRETYHNQANNLQAQYNRRRAQLRSPARDDRPEMWAGAGYWLELPIYIPGEV
jgi:hypothetical protein